MKSSKGRIWIPLLLVGIIALQAIAMPSARSRFHRLYNDDFDVEDYDSTFAGWSADSLLTLADSLIRFAPIDSIDDEPFVTLPDSLADSLYRKVDSIVHHIYYLDSLERERIAFQKWFDSLPRKKQKIWIMENVTLPAKMHRMDSILARKDSLKTLKDSIIENTPRVLETPFIPDSMHFKRILLMTQDKRFGDFKIKQLDTSYNYNFYDYPFQRKDVGATWLGVAGSATQYFNYTMRDEEENAVFFTPYRAWTYDPSTVPTYNTKTAHTELGYWGTLLAGDKKEEINLRLLTTQNITPGLNVTFELNKFGGGGVMANNTTSLHNLGLTTNYLGKRYSVHAGWLHDKVVRLENGGFTDNMWIRDTLVDSKEIPTYLSKAENNVLRNTVFINQNLRIPLGRDSTSATTAFIGHSTEWSNFKKIYTDNITNDTGRKFYNNVFLLNSSSSADTMKVMKLDNKVYIRLQPWKEDAIVSKIDAGVGDKLASYYNFHNDEEKGKWSDTKWLNNIYAYAGVNGMVKDYFRWDAGAQFYFAGYQIGDFNVDANIYTNFYPFRKARKSPVSINARFHTDLTAPDWYQQHLLLNHAKWDNEFTKQSTTRVGGTIDIPYWKLKLDVDYTLRANPIYYDTLAVVRQHTEAPVSVIGASLRKEFQIWKFHLDNRLLFQYSSNNLVAPVPLVALNLRYFLEFTVVKNAMNMQIGANALFTTKWNMPGYNPNTGVFFNQNKESYGMCPYIDVFLNIQWKRACIFIKAENLNQGWPLDHGKDYFSAHNYIHTQRGFKFGILWPFYVQPSKKSNTTRSSSGNTSSSSSSSSKPSGGNSGSRSGNMSSNMSSKMKAAAR